MEAQSGEAKRPWALPLGLALAVVLAVAVAATLGIALRRLSHEGWPQIGIEIPPSLGVVAAEADGVRLAGRQGAFLLPLDREQPHQVVEVRLDRGALPALASRLDLHFNEPSGAASSPGPVVERVDGHWRDSLFTKTMSSSYSSLLLNLGRIKAPPADGEGVILATYYSPCTVSVDSSPVGEGMGHWVVRLAPGRHRVEATAPDDSPLALEVEVEPRTYRLLGIDLPR